MDRRVEEDRSLFANDLATHVIAIGRIVVHLDIDDLPLRRFEHHEDRWDGTSRPPLEGGNRAVLGAKHMAGDIEFMRRGIGDSHVAGQPVGSLHVAVEVMHHQGGSNHAI